MTDDELVYAHSIIDDANSILMKIPGVIGVGITHSRITGIGNEYQIFVHIKDESVIRLLPNDIHGMRIVYSISGEIKIKAFAEIVENDGKGGKKYYNNIQGLIVQTGRYRPVVGGISGGLYGAHVHTTGTIGCIAKDTSGRNVFVSNNHVFAFDIGNIPYKGAKGEPIIQPGSVDGGVLNNDNIATLEKWIPLTATGNKIDAAYALPTVDVSAPGLCNLYTGTSINPTIGMSVSKSGRTTGCTTGQVESINYTVNCTYEISSSTTTYSFQAQVADCITITGSGPMSQVGDSGSMWVTTSGNNAVGLNFAGTSPSDSAVACKAKNVESILGVVFGDGSGGGGDCTTSPVVNLNIGNGNNGGGGDGELRFSCKDALDNNGNILTRYCDIDPNGQYSSLQDCNNACPMFKYTCKKIVDNNGNVLTKYCTTDVNGQYNSFSDCRNVCK